MAADVYKGSNKGLGIQGSYLPRVGMGMGIIPGERL